MPDLKFSVDAALLRELGERLVGQAHIALAELIKNAYDADARHVEVSIAADAITVSDDGTGMSLDDFKDYWMRVGSPHKTGGTSPELGRQLTGSKGVGRLSAQFLARELTVVTKTEGDEADRLRAHVDWDAAIESGDLTAAKVRWKRDRGTRSFAAGSNRGTRLELRGLKQDWDANRLRRLAKELWPLRPPFGAASVADGDKLAFDITLEAEDDEAEAVFREELVRVLDLFVARVTGRLLDADDEQGEEPTGPRRVALAVAFRDESRVHTHELILDPCHLGRLDFEVRVFDLHGRQPHRIPVEAARDYLRDFGGVHVYDAGFHLPYYGPAADWLRVEFDHAHRLSRSKLLPSDMQVDRGLNFLPTNSRLYGVVNVDTGRELQWAAEHFDDPEPLTVQVSRDRLVDNEAYQDVITSVRTSMDLYAMTAARRAARLRIAGQEESEPLSDKIRRIEDVVDRYDDEIATPVSQRLRADLRAVADRVETDAEAAAGRAALLGSLATAGITAVAFEHEFNRRLGALERDSRRLVRAANGGNHEAVKALATDIRTSVREARETREVFSPLIDPREGRKRVSLKASATLQRTMRSLRPYVGEVEFLDEVPPAVRLPPGRPAEWTSLFQNLIVNAAAAMLHTDSPRLRARHLTIEDEVAILLDDNGVGIDLNDAERLFEPFERESELTDEEQVLGFGGTGLGLTIVRMLAAELRCRVQFIVPPAEWNTTVEVSWRKA